MYWREQLEMKLENPFWNEQFSENLPKWLHIWIVSIAFLSGILFCFAYITNYIQKEHPLLKIVAIAGIVCSLLLVLNRDSFLPFLSENFLPYIFLQLKERKPTKAEKTIEIKVKPNQTVLYWSADPAKEVQKTWKLGYNKFENSGVIKANEKGIAMIPIECPARYRVHGYKILPKHMHYRTFNEETQMLSRIHTVLLSNQCPN